jgi:hypothetical protein
MARRLLPILLLSIVVPSACMAQRYGRPYTLAQSPQILLLVKTDKNHHYFRPSDLKKLPRTVVTMADPVSNLPHTYEGVALEQLLPSGGALTPNGLIEIEFDSHQKITIPTIDLDTQPKVIIADTIDGKPLSGDAPYWFVAKSRDKAVQKVTDVETITVR